MANRIVLDSAPVSLLCHPSHGTTQVQEVRRWFRARRRAGDIFYLSDIIDYEVRRELLRIGSHEGIERLEQLQVGTYRLRITGGILRRAAELWAQARTQGTPTAADPALDVDMILAAQAEAMDAIVVTENVRHLALFVTAMPWRSIRRLREPASGEAWAP